MTLPDAQIPIQRPRVPAVDLSLHIRRSALWDLAPDFRVWLFRCDLCDEDMEFATWQDAQNHAQAHGMKHDEAACPTCGHRPYIREDWLR